jgi:7-carboxy-7-deazaguanine synthase
MRLAELFYSIQGEGKLAGVPSVFIRASGCNLRCVWCDTPYASWNPEGADVPVDQIVQRVAEHPAKHIVLTGGEPLIMPDAAPLCAALRKLGYHITVETAATVFQDLAIDLASLSPKLSNSTPDASTHPALAQSHERQRLRPEVIQRFIDTAPDFQLKFVVSGPHDLAEIKSLLNGLKNWTSTDVLLMPEGTDAKTLADRSGWIAKACQETGYRYCPRLHIDLYGNRRGT